MAGKAARVIQIALILWPCARGLPGDAATEAAAGEAPSEKPVELAPGDYVLSLDGKKVPITDSMDSVTVITGDDLRAMGIHTLPEVFRYVAGVDVFQLNGFTYAVGVRGVSDEFNPRTHVYLDGRLVNVPEFGGVDWESIPVSVDDIERIEIIRAVGVEGESGSSLQGAIRIWSRKPADAPLLTYSGYAGTDAVQIHFGRAAATLGPLSAKVAVEWRTDDGADGKHPSGLIAPRVLDDGQDLLKANLGLGWTIDPSTELFVRFTGLHGKLDESAGDPVSNGPTDTENYAVSAELRRIFGCGLRLVLGYYFEDFRLRVNDYPGAPLHSAGDDIDLHRNTHSIHASARMPLLSILDLTATAGWKEDRLMFERNNPQTDDQEIYHLNLGGELRPLDVVTFAGGLQIERDLFSGLDFSPFAGGVYRFLSDHLVRLSYRVGRRKPNFTEKRIGFVVPNPVPPPATLPLISGNRNIDRETVFAYEGGYRGMFDSIALLVDFQLFLHELKDRITLVSDPTSPVPGALTFDNRGEERAFGTELFAEWAIWGPLSAYGTYTYQTIEDAGNNRILRDRPRHKANAGLRLRFDEGLLRGVSAFLNLNYVTRVQQLDITGTRRTIGERYRVDFRIAKSFLDERLEVALIGRNILDSDTVEFRPVLGSNWDGAFGSERLFLANLLLRF